MLSDSFTTRGYIGQVPFVHFAAHNMIAISDAAEGISFFGKKRKLI